MSFETSKSALRRSKESVFTDIYIVGHGIDIGSGNEHQKNYDGLSKYRHLFPKMETCRDWDVQDGDAQYMGMVKDYTYEFVHSSHCLEHMSDPIIALRNWLRILKVGGHLICTVPDYDLYEQGVWPSRFNGDHKSVWGTYKIVDIFNGQFRSCTMIKKIQLIEHNYNYSLQYKNPPVDQTGNPDVEAAIEFVVQKTR